MKYAVLVFALLSASLQLKGQQLPAMGYCYYTAGATWIPVISSGTGSGFTPGTSTLLYGMNGAVPAALTCDSSGHLTPGGTAGGDLSGTYPNPSVVGLKTVPFCTGFTPTNGQFVQYTTGGTPNPCYSAAAGGSGSFSQLSGDANSTATGGATTVTGINNTSLAGLSTGLLVNTTATGVPSVVAAPAGAVVGTTDTQALTNKTVDGVTPTVFGYLDPTSSVQTQLNSKGAGTVTAVSVATANGVSGSSSGGATPALTIALGAITPTSTNGVSSTTMAFMDATSSVQTQLNAKAASNASTTANGQTCALGSTCTVSGGTNTQTTNYTLVASDLGKLVIMNCSGACTVTLYGSPTAGYYGAIESIGSTVATVSLNSKNFNGASSVPVLNSFRPLEFWSDSTNYFGLSPLVAGSGISFTPASNGVTIALNLPSQYKTWTCQPGLGDGTNAMTAATYLQSECWNTTGVTVTLTGISCYTDNSGSSTLNAAGNTLGALLTGAVTCSSSLAAGTQSANVLLTNGDYIKATFVADGTSKQTTWVFTGTY